MNVFEINQPIIGGVRCELKLLTFTLYIGGYIFYMYDVHNIVFWHLL